MNFYLKLQRFFWNSVETHKKLGLDKTRERLESVFGMGAEKLLLDQNNPLQVELAEARLCPDDVSGTNDDQKAA